MSMINYIKSLLPNFGQDRIIDDLSRMRAEAEENLLPSLQQASRAFHGQKLQSQVAKNIEATLQERFRSHGSMFDILYDIFKDVPAKLDVLDEAAEEFFAKDVTKESLTYRRATVLKYAETLNFAMNYTVRTVLRVIAAETCVAAGAPEQVDTQLSPKERSYFDSKMGAWIDTLVLLTKSAADVKAALVTVPDVAANEHDAEAVAAVTGHRSLDPLGLNFIAPSINPIYHFRMMLAEWDVAAINQSKEERKLVELRLRELKNRQHGVNDARIQHQIELTEDRLKKLDFAIARMSGQH